MDLNKTNPQNSSTGQVPLNLPALQANHSTSVNAQKKPRAISDDTQASTVLLSASSQNHEEQKKNLMTGLGQGKKLSAGDLDKFDT